MSNNQFLNKFVNRMFRRIDGIVWDLTSGKQGIATVNGIHTLNVTSASVAGAGDTLETTSEYEINVNPFDTLGMSLPAFATQTPIENVKLGDIVVGDSAILGWVTGKTGKSLKLLDVNGMNKNYTPPKTAILGGVGPLVVQNLALNGATGGTPLDAILPLLLADDDFDIEGILPFLLMQGQGAPAAGAAGAAPAINPLMLMALSGKGNIDPMMLMAMSGGLGGGAGAAGGLGNMLPLLLASKNKGGDSDGGLDLTTLALMGGLGGAGGAAGGMNPLLLASLIGKKGGNGVPALKKVRSGNSVSGYNAGGVPDLIRTR